MSGRCNNNNLPSSDNKRPTRKLSSASKNSNSACRSRMNARCKDSKKRARGPFKNNLRPKTAWLNEASNTAVPMAKPSRRLTARSLNSQSNQKATDQAQVLERVLHSPNSARAECTAPNLLAGIHLVACTVNRQHSTTQLLQCLAKIQREACLVSNRTCSE